jgi:thiol-disulfide isomerase/thioredoxin
MKRLAIAVAALALVSSACGSNGATNDTAYGTVTITGSLPQYGGEPDAAAGMALPEVSGTGLDGEAESITRDGSAKVIVMLAHWCPHCQAEVPRLVDWMASGDIPQGVEVIGIATATTAERPNYPPGAWL